MRQITHGRQPETAPAATFREVLFPELMRLDEGTGEGVISRSFASEGANVLNLPRTISMQYIDDEGHKRSVPVGALHEVFIDGEAKRMSAKGWLADTPDGHLAEIVILSQALSHNSADLGNIPPGAIELIEHGEMWDDDFYLEVHFKEFSLTKTTLVATPAFSNAHATLPDEVTAALGSDTPLVIDVPSFASGHTSVEEIMAGATSLPSWDHFHREEPAEPHKIITGTPDADGWIPVYGNLALWSVPHRGYDGRTVYPPRPRNAYREFNQPSVLTDRGQVEAGPIALYGGHVSLADAANDPRNAWCDVKVSAGKHGPWVCGVVRPHVAASDADLYAARASRISGHWKGGDLCMIVSVNSEGFNVPGRGWEPAEEGELVAALTVSEEDVIIAGFETPQNLVAMPADLLSLDVLTPEGQQRTLEWAASLLGKSTALNGLPPHGSASSISPTTAADDEPEFDEDQAHRDRMIALYLEDEVDA